MRAGLDVGAGRPAWYVRGRGVKFLIRQTATLAILGGACGRGLLPPDLYL